MALIEQIEKIFHLLNDNRIEELGLFRVENGKLITPLVDDTLSLFTYRSKRADEIIEQNLIGELIASVQAGANFRGVNHIGFCYKVDSKDDEIRRITQKASSRGLTVYQEPSNDDAAWIFVGDLSEIANPLLEFLPHEGKVVDKWVDYWLPHIQFDIDTGLTARQIESLVYKWIDRPFTPYPIKIDGVTYIQRVNLGCIEGINLMLDLSTNSRDINYRKSWTKLT
jgi:hypothetical protein